LTTDTTLRFPPQPVPLDGPLPEELAAFEAEFVVEWQVASGADDETEK
jgi:hypothetical protein